MVKNPPANAGDIRDTGSVPRLGRSLEEGMATHSNIAWRIPVDREAWWAMVPGSHKGWTRLKPLSMHV